MSFNTLTPMKDAQDYLMWKDALKFVKVAENLRDKALLRLLVATGRRVSEILNLKVSDIDFKKKNITWLILKKKKPHRATIPVDEVTLLILTQYIEKYKIMRDDYLFKGYKTDKPLTKRRVHQIVRYYAEKYEILAQNGKYPHPHTFRHTFASYLAEKSQNIQDIHILKQYLQHSNIDMTLYYIQVSSKQYRALLERGVLDVE